MNHPTRLCASALLLTLFLFLMSGCQEDPGNAAVLVRPIEGDVATLQEASGLDDATMHQTLEAMWKNTDGVLMQVFTQTIDCRVGGLLTAHPVGWPEGYDVSLTVDPGTLPLNHDPIVDFVMEVPVTGPTADAFSIPYEFHPDGIQFNQPVHVAVAWPQWAGTVPASGMHLWYLEKEVHDGNQHYRVVNREPEDAVLVAANKANLATISHFSINHFSRWSLGGDSTADDDPIASLFGAVLAATAEGDCCWTDYAASPTTEIQVEF